MYVFSVRAVVDYIKLEYEHGFQQCACVHEHTPWSTDRVVDDLVLLTMLVGNDFLPGLPGFTIIDNGLDTLLQVKITNCSLL